MRPSTRTVRFIVEWSGPSQAGRMVGPRCDGAATSYSTYVAQNANSYSSTLFLTCLRKQEASQYSLGRHVGVWPVGESNYKSYQIAHASGISNLSFKIVERSSIGFEFEDSQLHHCVNQLLHATESLRFQVSLFGPAWAGIYDRLGTTSFEYDCSRHY